MRVLVTGGGGFVGSYLCQSLVEAGHTVAVLIRGSLPWRLEALMDRLSVIRGDLQLISAWKGQLMEFAPDAIAHSAWTGVANFDRNNPDQIRNIGWTADLLRLGHRAGARVFLGLGSQAENGIQPAPIGPDSPTAPTTLYGETKLATGRLTARLAEIEGVRFVWMRVFSIFGPSDHPYWMIPGLIGTLLKGERPALTLGEQSWDFLHVADAAKAARLSIEQETASGFYTLGSGRAPTLRSTIEAIRDQINPELPLGFGDVAYRPDQVMRLQADVTALKRDLGWEPEIDLRRGLRETRRVVPCQQVDL